MMLSYGGFNELQQFGSDNGEGGLRGFKDFAIDETFSGNESILISAAWTYTVFATRNALLVQGLIGSVLNCKLRLTAPALITQIAAVDEFCVVLLDNGKLYKLKPIQNAILEEIKFAVIPLDGNQSQPPVTHFACGDIISVAINTANEIFNIPNKIYQFPKHFRVKQLLCGFEHALLLSGNGDIYAWGYGLRGQLGQSELEEEEEPLLVDALAGIKITFIATGGWHCAAISAFGDLYTWGFNTNGQLGMRLFNVSKPAWKLPVLYPLPQIIDLPLCCVDQPKEEESGLELKCEPIKVFAGARHTIVQMNCGTLYGAGWDRYGQLGLRQPNVRFKDQYYDCDTFEKLSICPKDVLSGMEIYCGHWCTVFKK